MAVRRAEGEGLVVVLLGGLGVLQHGFRRLAALAGFVEALVMDHADLFDAPGTAQRIVRVAQGQAAPVGGFGGVQVADGGQVLVGVAEVVVGDGFGGGVADALVVANGFLVRCHAVGAALLHQDLAQGDHADAQRADAVALLGVQGRGGRQGEGGRGLLAVPGDELFLQRGRRGEVAVVVLGQVDAVVHDQAVAVLPAGDGARRPACSSRARSPPPAGPIRRCGPGTRRGRAGPAWRR